MCQVCAAVGRGSPAIYSMLNDNNFYLIYVSSSKSECLHPDLTLANCSSETFAKSCRLPNTPQIVQIFII